ncbi:hypothetical protein NBH08_07340 [Faecalicatena sp. BF-R-105]|nr:hypothetical protein [Faecalicatena sp. BF-R-105]
MRFPPASLAPQSIEGRPPLCRQLTIIESAAGGSLRPALKVKLFVGPLRRQSRQLSFLIKAEL